MNVQLEFVDTMPAVKQPGVLYVSMRFATAIHLCACGCGNQVVTPFEATGWSMTFDGDSVTLYPSIGNWSFPCRSHYWVRRNRIVWADTWDDEEIDNLRAREQRRRARHYKKRHGGEQ